MVERVPTAHNFSLSSFLRFGSFGSLLFGGLLTALLSHIPFDLGARDDIAAVLVNWRQVAVVNHGDDPRRINQRDTEWKRTNHLGTFSIF
jgi:hypothetical protein